jgi:hypothetical protein
MMSSDEFKACIEACYACTAACDHCSTACLQEDDVKMMARCIALDMDCAQICRTAADECGKHPMDHCQACAQACRACADACRRMAGAG